MIQNKYISDIPIQNIMLSALLRFLKENNMHTQYNMLAIRTYLDSQLEINLQHIVQILTYAFTWSVHPCGYQYMYQKYAEFIKIAFFLNLVCGDKRYHGILYRTYRSAILCHDSCVREESPDWIKNGHRFLSFFENMDFDTAKMLYQQLD